MASFQAWNLTTQGGTLAMKESFATSHPILTATIFAAIMITLFAIWYWQLNKDTKKEEANKK